MATALVHPAEAARILNGKQAMVKPSAGSQLVARFQIGLNLSASRVGIGFGGLRRQIG